MEDFPDVDSNKILAIALRNLEIVLAVYYSPAFIGSQAGFRLALQTHFMGCKKVQERLKDAG